MNMSIARSTVHAAARGPRLSRRWLALMAIALLGVCGPGVFAQGYPSKPLRMLVGAPPGGTTDIVARMIAQKLGERLGQTVVVENRAGAGGNIGMDGVAKAAPDGYTFGMAYSGLSINPSVMKAMPFDTLRDLAPVSLVATVPMFLIVDPAMQVTSVKELIDRAKANPGKLAIAASSFAAVSHLSAELLKQRAGIDMTTVVYKGSAPAWVDVMGGRVAAMFDTVAGSSPHVKAGKLRAIAVGGSKRMSTLPDVPTLQESGLPDFEIRSWYGVVAPAKTPPEIIERVSREIAEIVKAADLRENFASQMLEPVGNSPAEFGAFIRSEMRLWEPVARSADIKMA